MVRVPTGADLLCDLLLEHGVEVLFGHPGGAILPFYDALHRKPELRHILMRHEQAAAHAADGYSRATGKTGVCIATSGPGATNLVTGLATAMMDGVPLVAITGQVPLPVLGTDAFQETDIVGVTMPVTKHGFQINQLSDIPDMLAAAFSLAVEGRPGPVLIDFPKDIQASLVSTELVTQFRGFSVKSKESADLVTTLEKAESNSDCVQEIRVLLEMAKRPLLMVGRGAVEAGVTEQIRDFAETMDLPVTTTLLGIDGFPAEHRLSLGLPGMHGTERANMGIQNADLVIGLGCRFDDRVIGKVDEFAPKAKVVAFDINPGMPGRTIEPDVFVLGDLRDTLPELIEGISKREYKSWFNELSEWSREAEPTVDCSLTPGPLGGRQAVRHVTQRVSDCGGIVCTDVGQHQMWVAQELPNVMPRSHLTSGGLGTMGYSLPAAIGAAVGCPERTVWVVAGDGGFQMNIQELATVAQENIALRIAVINNQCLGMVRQWQESFYERRYSAVALSGPDLVKVASAYGIEGYVVEKAENLKEILDSVSEEKGPVLVDLRVVEDENVYPIVPTGTALHDLIKGPALPTQV